jgi:hypothetical protein
MMLRGRLGPDDRQTGGHILSEAGVQRKPSWCWRKGRKAAIAENATQSIRSVMTPPH